MSPDRHDIPIIGDFYTKAEVDKMIADALEEARAIDEKSMADHNFKATIISMILGLIYGLLLGVLAYFSFVNYSFSIMFGILNNPKKLTG